MPFTVPPFGLPRDPAPWIALLAAPLALLLAGPLLRPAPRSARFLAVAALAALALSAAYVAGYLRGGPRIIDATSYLLEARAIAAGHLAWPLGDPATATLGRFLVRSEHPAGDAIAVIFPPGYPLFLALGVLLHAPMIMGPLLAAALVVATSALAETLPTPGNQASTALSVPRLAALLSVTCAALRYHTADTMAHGLAALTVTATLALLVRALDETSPRRSLALAALSGLFVGWLVATRPVSALALAPVLALALVTLGAPARSHRVALAFALLAGAIPGVALLLAHQHASTGVIGLSAQRLYYALSDGPPGCFRYGFGAGVGCVGEHGDFVRANLPDGYGALAATATTLRRLKAHLVDPANLELLALLVPLGAALRFREPRVRLLALAIALQIAAYVPFYFDGNYPGGGARFFAEVLPIEHILIAVAVAELAARRPRIYAERWGAALLALALAGFACRAGFDHALLRDREGGRPMFERRVLERAGVDRGLLFLDTDHGFNLALDPAVTDAARGIVAARLHGDGLDRLTWDAHGRPLAYRYRFSFDAAIPVTVEPLAFPADAPSPLVIEAESLWPPLAQKGGWALPTFASGTCASGGRWLALHADRDATAEVTIAIPLAAARDRSITPTVVIGPASAGSLTLVVDGIAARVWALDASADRALRCIALPTAEIPAAARQVHLMLTRPAGLPPSAILAVDEIRFEPPRRGGKTIDP